MKHPKLIDIIKEELGSFKIDPKLTAKIYDILVKKIPEVQQEFPTRSAFFTYINDNL